MTEFSKAIDILDKMDFFHGQKAEIERLKSMNQSKLDMIHDLRAEIERLDVLSEQLGKDVDVKLKYIYELEAINESMKEDKPFIKAEAYKEFAERLKDMSEATWWFDENEPTKAHVEHYVLQSDIDKLVKEMTGGKG